MAKDSTYFRWKMIEESKDCFQSLLAYQIVSLFQTLLQKGFALGVVTLNVSVLSWFKGFLHERIVFSLCKYLHPWTDLNPWKPFWLFTLSLKMSANRRLLQQESCVRPHVQENHPCNIYNSLFLPLVKGNTVRLLSDQMFFMAFSQLWWSCGSM